MMTQQLEVSILAAPLAAIDRRALSQAWYSALRLERSKRAAAATVQVRRDERESGASLGRPPAFSRNGVRAVALDARVRKSGPARSVGDGGDAARPSRARVARAPLARAIANAFVEPRPTVKRATFSLGRGNARIHVVLQTNGERATLVAFCPPQLRIVVAHALENARLALKSRGIGLDACAKEGRPCS